MGRLSNITIEEVEFTDDSEILSPFPPTPLKGPHSGVDPDGLINSGAPPEGDDAYVLAIHAVDPQVGPDPPLTVEPGPDGPTPIQAGSAATALSTIVGLRALKPDERHTDVTVPIFRTPQVEGFPPDGDAETYPPNPGGTTDVAVTLWYNRNPGEGFNFLPRPIKDADGNAIVDTAAIENLGGTGPT